MAATYERTLRGGLKYAFWSAVLFVALLSLVPPAPPCPPPTFAERQFAAPLVVTPGVPAGLWHRLEALNARKQSAAAAEASLFAALGKGALSATQRRFGSVNEMQVLLYSEFAAALAPNSTICEVGFYHGLSTLIFLLNAPPSTTYECACGGRRNLCARNPLPRRCACA